MGREFLGPRDVFRWLTTDRKPPAIRWVLGDERDMHDAWPNRSKRSRGNRLDPSEEFHPEVGLLAGFPGNAIVLPHVKVDVFGACGSRRFREGFAPEFGHTKIADANSAIHEFGKSGGGTSETSAAHYRHATRGQDGTNPEDPTPPWMKRVRRLQEIMRP